MLKTIESQRLRVTVNTIGAVLDRIDDKTKQRQLIAQKEADGWKYSDVVIFPVIGKGRMVFEDGEARNFNMLHGCLREMSFEVTQHTENSIHLITAWNQETYAVYPYRFTVEAIYTIVENTIRLSWKVSCEDGKMPFEWGSHLGLRVKNGAGRICFEKPETLRWYHAGKNAYEPIPDEHETEELCFDKDFFREHATGVTFDGYTGNVFRVWDEDGLRYTWKVESPAITLWSHPAKGDFICVEQLWGVPTTEEAVRLENLPYIQYADEKPWQCAIEVRVED